MKKNEACVIKLGIVADFPEERWESMDLVAEMAVSQLKIMPELGIEPVLITPTYRPMCGRLSASRMAWNIDRYINRRLTLPRGVKAAIRRERPDVVFVVDHSYAHIVPTVQAEGVPALVMCHDLDAFSAILQPAGNGLRQRLRRAFSRPILEGLLRADHVLIGSDTVRDQFLKSFGDTVPAERLTTVAYGVAPEYLDTSSPSVWPFHGLGDASRPILLHVGSTIPRKRIDVLLQTVAELAKSNPGATLVRVGGPLTQEQRDSADKLGIANRIREMPRLSRAQIAELYRRADVVLVTSDAEGFGLPVAESLASGAEVVASDIPVLRETGGPCVRYAEPGNPRAFAEQVRRTLAAGKGYVSQDLAEVRRLWVSRYRWDTFAADLAAIVREVAVRHS